MLPAFVIMASSLAWHTYTSGIIMSFVRVHSPFTTDHSHFSVQECDATGDEKRNKAGYKKTTFI